MKSIKGELLLVLGIIAVLAVISISIPFSINIYKSMLPHTNTIAKQILRAKTDLMGNWLEKQKDIIKLVANSNMAKMGKVDDVLDELDQIYKKSPNVFSELFYVNKNGVGQNTSGNEINISYKNYFKILINGQKDFIITDPFTSSTTGREVFIMASIIKNTHNEITGVVGGTVYMNQLTTMAKSINIGGYGYGWIINDAGLIIAHPNKTYILNFNVMQDEKKYGFNNVSKVFEKRKPNIINYGTIVDPHNVKKIVFFTLIPYSNNWYLGVSIPSNQLYENINNLKNILIVFIIFLIVSLILIAIFVSDNISKPLKELSQGITVLKDGNLNIRFNESRKDEIGVIQRALNKLTESLNNILLNVQSSSEKISSISSEIASSNEDFSRRILGDSSKIEQISATTQELTASFDLTAENANGSIEIANKTIQTTKENESNIEKTVQSVEKLSNISTKIGEIMNFINKVAFQTNLLAVNASVEAARVGKEGSGFAVVAAEIRSLSKKISEYSLEIGKLLASNQIIVNEVSISTQNAKESFKLMEEYINEFVEKSNGISLSVMEQSDAIRQIADAIIDISSSMQENVEVARKIADVTSSLSMEAKRLNALTSEYKVDKDNDDKQ